MRTVYLKIVLDADDDHGPKRLVDELERVGAFIENECGGYTVLAISAVTPSEMANQPAPAPPGIPRHHIDDLDAGKERLLEYVEEEMDIHEVAQVYSLLIDREHVITVESSDAYYRGERVILGI